MLHSNALHAAFADSTFSDALLFSETKCTSSQDPEEAARASQRQSRPPTLITFEASLPARLDLDVHLGTRASAITRPSYERRQWARSVLGLTCEAVLNCTTLLLQSALLGLAMYTEAPLDVHLEALIVYFPLYEQTAGGAGVGAGAGRQDSEVVDEDDDAGKVDDDEARTVDPTPAAHTGVILRGKRKTKQLNGDCGSFGYCRLESLRIKRRFETIPEI